MNVVKIATSDSKIWNVETVIADLIQASQKGSVTIDLLEEGPCCESVGLNAILFNLVSCFGFDKDQYTILTSNQISSSPFREKHNSFVELTHVQQLARNSAVEPSSLKKRFGIFISRSNWPRLLLASYLNTCYQDQTVMTYHYDPKSNYHSSNFGLEEMLNRNWNDVDVVLNFLKKLPICFEKQDYPILWHKQAMNLDRHYSELFCDVICETYFSGKVFFLTEKTMRAIINKRPFLVQGPTNFLKNLRLLGFKTFDAWWDEGYDEDPWDYRPQALKNNIDFIAKQTPETIKQWYDDMQDVLNHNYKVFMQLTDDKIAKTQFYA